MKSMNPAANLKRTYGAILSFALCSAIPLNAAAERPLAAAYDDVIHGGFVRAANTLVECDELLFILLSHCNDTNLVGDLGLLHNNDDTYTRWADVDSDLSTENSSSATLALPADSTVAWAGLYWAGNEQSDGGLFTRTAVSSNIKEEAKLRIPGSSAYTTITADWCDTIDSWFVCYADVSSIVSMGGAGDYTVADVRINTGLNSFSGGWELMVAHENPSLPLRDLSVYDGHVRYGDGTTQAFDFDDILTPLSGQVSGSIGVSINEGDHGLGDVATFQAGASASVMLGDDPLNALLTPNDDLANGSLTVHGSNVTTRNPAHRNTLGFDVDVFDASPLLGNGELSARVELGNSSGEVNFLYKVDLEVDIHFPDVELEKTVLDLNGGDVVVGDTLEYTLTVRNAPTALDAAINVTLTDDIPDGLTYQPGTMSVRGVGEVGFTSMTDSELDLDVGFYTPGTERLTLHAGAGAGLNTGGVLAAGDEVTLVFRVTVDAMTDPTRLENTALASHAGEALALNGTVRTILAESFDPTAGTDGPTVVIGLPDLDGDGLGCVLDLDEDNDGILDLDESGGVNPDLDFDGDLLEDWRDPDAPNFIDVNVDGTDDRFDFDLDGIPNHRDLDSDGDGVPDLHEVGGRLTLDADADGVVDGSGDADQDGILDAVDADFMGSVTLDLTIDTDGTELPDILDIDDDGDGILTAQELADVIALGDSDLDRDLIPAWRDTDSDGDLTDDEDETDDADADGTPDYLDLDITLIDTPTAGATFTTRTISAQGTAAPGLAVTLDLLDANGAPTATLSVNADPSTGAWSADLTANSDGAFTLRARVTDATTNTSEDSVDVSVDTIAPTPAITSPSSGATVDSDVSVMGTCDDATAVLHVTVDQGTAAERELGPVALAANGDWTLDVTGLTNGAHTLSARATDAAGNNATDGPIDVTVASQSMTLTLDAPTDGARLNDPTPSIIGKANPNSVVTLNLDDATPDAQPLTAQANGSGDWFLFSPALADGQHTLLVSTDDGNGGTLDRDITFEIDTVAPTLTLTTPVDGDVSNDASPTITGTGDDGDTVEVFADGAKLGEVTVTPNGWTMPWPTSPLTEGHHVISVTATDPAGNTSTESANLRIDQTDPSLTMSEPVDGSTSADSTPTASGNTEPHSTVTLSVDGTPVGSSAADAFGAWSIATPDALTNGPHTFSAQVEDAAGNTSPVVEATVTIDSTLPLMDLTSPADGSSISNQTPTLRGTADPNLIVTLTVDAVEVGTTMTSPSGDWSFALTNALTEGAHTVVADVTDGTNLATDMATFTVDITQPSLSVATPTQNDVLAASEPEFTGTTEPGALVELTLPDGSMEVVTADNTGAWTLTPQGPMADGQHTVNAAAIDEAGNRSPTENVTFTVDTTAPAIAITSPHDGSVSNQTDPTFTGTSEPGAVLELRIGTTLIDTVSVDAAGDWQSDAGGPFTDGVHTLEATATDSAGNSTTDDSDFIVDTRAPALSITTPTQGQVVATRPPLVTGSAEPDAEVELSVDGNVVGQVTASASGAWIFTLPTELTDGQHVISAHAEDEAGNTSNLEVTITVSVLSMDLTVTSPSPNQVLGDATPTITGTANPGDTAEIFIDGTKVGEVIADSDGWELTVNTVLDEGDHTVTVSTEGGATTGPVTFTVDTTAPSIAITSPTPGFLTNDPRPTLQGTGEPGMEVTISVDDDIVGTTTPDDDGVWTHDLAQDLDDGDHIIEATSSDAGGNAGSSGDVDLTVDTIAPPIDITSPGEGENTQGGADVTGSSEPLARVLVILDGEELGSVDTDDQGLWSFPLPDTLSAGTSTLRAEARDPAGNSSFQERVVTVEEADEPGQYILSGGCRGCSSAPGAPADASLLFLALGLIGWRRKKRAA